MLRTSLKPYLALPRPVHTLIFASFVNFLGNFVTPFMTLFLTGKAGLSPALVGILVACNAAAGMLGNLSGGKLTDMLGRKRILLFFRTLAAGVFLICGFTTWVPALVAMLMLAAFLTGIAEPGFQTMLTDLTRPEERQFAFSLHYIALNVGYAVSTVIAGYLYMNHTTALFTGDAVTTLLSMFTVLMLVPETKPDAAAMAARNVPKSERAREGSTLKLLLEKPVLLGFCISNMLLFGAFIQFNFGLPLQLTDINALSGPVMFGWLVTFNSVLCAILTAFVASLSSRYPAALSMIAGALCYIVGFGMLTFVSSLPLLFLSTLIWTLGEILVTTSSSVYLAAHSPISHRGRFSALMPVLRRTGMMAFNSGSGVIIQQLGVRMLWPFIAGAACVAGVILSLMHRADVRTRAQDDALAA